MKANLLWWWLDIKMLPMQSAHLLTFLYIGMSTVIILHPFCAHALVYFWYLLEIQLLYNNVVKPVKVRRKGGPRKMNLEKTCSPKMHSTTAVFSANGFACTVIIIKNLSLH